MAQPPRSQARLQIRLTAIDEPLFQAWRRWCGDLAFVSVYQGSIFDEPADAIVSPANSFGFMDGGIDRLYLERFGQSLQDRVQAQIRQDLPENCWWEQRRSWRLLTKNFPFSSSHRRCGCPCLWNRRSMPFWRLARSFC